MHVPFSKLKLKINELDLCLSSYLNLGGKSFFYQLTPATRALSLKAVILPSKFTTFTKMVASATR